MLYAAYSVTAGKTRTFESRTASPMFSRRIQPRVQSGAAAQPSSFQDYGCCACHLRHVLPEYIFGPRALREAESPFLAVLVSSMPPFSAHQAGLATNGSNF